MVKKLDLEKAKSLREKIELTKVVLEEFVETVDGVELKGIKQIMTLSHKEHISAIITRIINPITGRTEAVDFLIA